MDPRFPRPGAPKPNEGLQHFPENCMELRGDTHPKFVDISAIKNSVSENSLWNQNGQFIKDILSIVSHLAIITCDNAITPCSDWIKTNTKVTSFTNKLLRMQQDSRNKVFRTCDLLEKHGFWFTHSVVNVDLVKSCFYTIFCSQNELAYLQFYFLSLWTSPEGIP